MDITLLEAFKTIAETGSLTRAAELLHTSQPALSTQLRRLEGELGAELFHRAPNRVRLNGAGELALEHVNTILRDVDSLRNELKRYVLRDSSLIVAFCDPGVQWWAVPRFSMVEPGLQLFAQRCGADALSLLLDRTCDAVVVPGELRHAQVECVPFVTDQVYLSASKKSGLEGKSELSLRELPAQPLLLPTFGGYLTQTIEGIVAEERPDITIVKNDFPIIQHMIRTTNFISTVSTLSMELRYDGEERVFLPLVDSELTVNYVVACLKGNKGPVRHFLSWAKSLAG